MNRLTKVLQFVNILDSKDNLSLTNVFLIIAALYIGLDPDSLVAIGAGVLAVLNYAHKRHEGTVYIKEKMKEVRDSTIKDLQDRLSEITNVADKVDNKVSAIESKVEDQVEQIKSRIKVDELEIQSLKDLTNSLSTKVSKGDLKNILNKQ